MHLLTRFLTKQTLLLTKQTLLGAIALTALMLPFPRPLVRSAVAQQLPPLPLEFNPREIGNPGRPGGRRRGGGSRGVCSAGLPLSAIAYADTQIITELDITRIDEQVGMLTTQPQPTLWFYLPQPLASTPTEFILRDASSQLLYQGRLVGSTDSGAIVAAPVPIALLPNVPYQWSLTIDCDESDRTTVRGWIESRTLSDSLTNDLSEANARNRAALYASAGYLQDSLTELARLRSLRPDDEAITQVWQDFLIALDLPELVNLPVSASCCSVSNAPIEAPIPEDLLIEESPEALPETAPEELRDLEELEELEQTERDTRTILQRARDRS